MSEDLGLSPESMEDDNENVASSFYPTVPSYIPIKKLDQYCIGELKLINDWLNGNVFLNEVKKRKAPEDRDVKYKDLYKSLGYDYELYRSVLNKKNKKERRAKKDPQPDVIAQLTAKLEAVEKMLREQKTVVPLPVDPSSQLTQSTQLETTSSQTSQFNLEEFDPEYNVGAYSLITHAKKLDTLTARLKNARVEERTKEPVIGALFKREINGTITEHNRKHPIPLKLKQGSFRGNATLLTIGSGPDQDVFPHKDSTWHGLEPEHVVIRQEDANIVMHYRGTTPNLNNRVKVNDSPLRGSDFPYTLKHGDEITIAGKTFQFKTVKEDFIPRRGDLKEIKELETKRDFTAALKKEAMERLNINSAQLKLILEKYGNKYNY
jgi:pSer/pThr/pTyr-binding forkhead associated (FHA) protein